MSGIEFVRRSQVLALGLVLAAGAGGYAIARVTPSTTAAGHVRASLKVADPSEGPSKSGFAPIVKQVLPNVVNISSSKVVRTPNQTEGMPADPFFQQFFGKRFGPGPEVPKQRREQSLGSGVIVSPEGYILTNNHVVAPAAGNKGIIRVVFADKSGVVGRVVGRDPKTDLAVIKVERHGLVVASLGDSDALKVGDSVIAVGTPLRLDGTVTVGIVSSLNRPTPLVDQSSDTDAVIGAIQTDAAINPGNSGGALVDGSGAVVGINFALLNPFSTGPEAGNIGLGFAIPINQARDIADQLIRTGSVKHPTLAVNARSVTQLNGVRDGALIEGVTAGGSGDKAGLKEKDVIVKVDNEVIDSSDRLVVAIREHKVGDNVTITYVRGKETRTAETTLQSD
jgi:serine protease Do